MNDAEDDRIDEYLEMAEPSPPPTLKERFIRSAASRILLGAALVVVLAVIGFVIAFLEEAPQRELFGGEAEESQKGRGDAADSLRRTIAGPRRDTVAVEEVDPLAPVPAGRRRVRRGRTPRNAEARARRGR